MKVLAAQREDIPAWLNLAREVEYLFGPMVEEESFRNALLGAIEEEKAFCLKAKMEKDTLVGGVVVDSDHNEIVWLAVAESVRGVGVGSLLLNYAIKLLGLTKPIKVVTFAESVKEGVAARGLYMKFGFRDREPVGQNPAGFPVVLMVKEQTER